MNRWTSVIVAAEQRIQFLVSQRCSVRPRCHTGNTDASAVDTPERPHFFPNKELHLREGTVCFLVFTPYRFLPFLGERYTISLYYIILKPSCHRKILWKTEGKPMAPSASRLPAAQRTRQLHKGMHFSYLCCSEPKDTSQTIHW